MKINPFARLSYSLWSPTNTLGAAQGLVVDLEDSYHEMRKREQPWRRVEGELVAGKNDQ